MKPLAPACVSLAVEAAFAVSLFLAMSSDISVAEEGFYLLDKLPADTIQKLGLNVDIIQRSSENVGILFLKKELKLDIKRFNFYKAAYCSGEIDRKLNDEFCDLAAKIDCETGCKINVRMNTCSGIMVGHFITARHCIPPTQSLEEALVKKIELFRKSFRVPG